MSANYVVDARNRTVHTTFSGVVTHRDPIQNVLSLRADPEFDASFSELIEFAEDSEVQLNSNDLSALLELDPFFKASRRALVVGSGPSVFGAARIFKLLRHDDRCVKIFGTREEALSWLASESPEHTNDL